MSDKNNPIRETDSNALDLAARLIGANRYGALGAIEPATGTPLVSRVAYAWTPQTGLFFTASDLSHHSKCLKSNPACSLMVGEPGKGDGLAHPRMTLVGSTSRLENSTPQRDLLRTTFLSSHPKAELYIDFADFGFYPVVVDRILLNGGFGKAYLLKNDDLAFLGD